jgi:hypothetical protein
MLDLASTGEARLYSSPTADEPTTPQPHSMLPWTDDLELCVQHLRVIALLYVHGADTNAQTQPHLETPLMLAAGLKNAAVVDMLCRMGANTELTRCGMLKLEQCQPFLIVLEMLRLLRLWLAAGNVRDIRACLVHARWDHIPCTA